MSDQLNHVLTVVAHGMLTELPAQLATAVVVAISAALYKRLRRRRAKTHEPRDAENS
ncbi:hypothetical protein SUDANB176_07828 (plasmid) [Streptomyces sp. enrichment culture]